MRSFSKLQSRRFFILVLIILFNVSTLMAQSWYVCLSSFKSEENAEHFMKELYLQGLDVCLDEHTDENGTLYRVLLLEPFESRDKARLRSKEIADNEAVKNSGITNLWICTGVPKLKAARRSGEKAAVPEVKAEISEIPELAVADAVEAPAETAVPEIEPPLEDIDIPDAETITLEKNDDEIPLNEEKPYSVKVRSYKEEQKAQNDKKRLEDKEIDAYVLKTYDDDSYFNFDLHAGAFETPEESEELQEKLEEMGIEDTEISDYNDISENIQQYEDVIQNETVTYNTGNDEIPDLFSQPVVKCIREFPINADFEIEKIAIYDLENITNVNSLSKDYEDYEIIEELKETFPGMQAASAALYKDELFTSEINILIASGDENCFEDFSNYMKEEECVDFAYSSGIFTCMFTQQNDVFYLAGINQDKSMFILLGGENFTDKELLAFMNNVNNDSSLLIYPQLRKSLLVLPKQDSYKNRKFVYFTLSKVDESYAEEKNYAEWAVPIVGHWVAKSYFDDEGEQVSVAFFDMDYDYIAKKIYQIFTDEKEQIEGDYSHSAQLENIDGWYLENTDIKEVSFSTKSYIISVDCSVDAEMGEEDLAEMGDDLQIWELK